MLVLGLSCYYHDAAAALIADGRLVAAAEEERFSRRKHDHGFPTHAIEFCLRRAGVSAKELDHVVFYEKPIRKFERIITTGIATAPASWRSFVRATGLWLGSRLQIRDTIATALGVDRRRISFAEHHLSHAASAFFCSPYDTAAVMTADGVGEWACATWGVGRGRSLGLEAEQRFPHSLGLLYSTFTAFLGFEVNEGEYKVMGLAPYGTPRYVDEIMRVLRIAPDGAIELDLDYFDFPHSLTRPYSGRFVGLFGEPFPLGDEGSHPRRADIAASLQVVTEDVLLRMARHVRERTGLDDLCLAGGVALNSTANGRLLREAGFRSLWIQPAAGDSGGALGAALLGWHGLASRDDRLRMTHAYWGEEPLARGSTADLPTAGARCSRLGEDAILDRTVELLVAGKVVGWCRSRFEWGPRALGHRSILADPRRAEMKESVNARIKYREPFRPFAPSMLREHAATYVDWGPGDPPEPGRFMLLVLPVREDQREVIPAVTHVDGTCRPQFVDEPTDRAYCELLRRFGAATGVPVLLNTSFNLRGEPIVNDARAALSTFERSDMDALVIEDLLIEKR